ncbi:dephospho-CoA kinase [Tahibacter amnicola]|uniref:dephospho-CoA kinase n=1 Tax=Tahibacter amnicola TaxID=2976241 RepID=UPI0031BB563A
MAVTGGIACGKTAVTDAFVRRGVNCYDADAAARAVVAPGQAALAQIAERFGPLMLAADGTLDRAALRRHVFSDTDARRDLEAIIHPQVRRWLREHVDRDGGLYSLLAIPLLAETWPAYAWADRVLVVDADPQLQLARLLARDAITPELARQMIKAQATREQRLAIANDVIENSGSLEQLDEAVAALHQRYCELAVTKQKTAP